ncbi:MAG: PH domain-containing protein [Candidatus Hodarchaeota archaeon]
MMYYLLMHKKQYGPYTEEQVRAMFSKGTIPSNTFVFEQGGAQKWQPLHNYPNLTKSPSPKSEEWAADPSANSIPINKSQELERTIWQGSPSNITIIGTYLKYSLVAIFFILTYVFIGVIWLPDLKIILAYIIAGIILILILKICWIWLVLKSTKWTLTTERFNYEIGIFSRRIENMELYRIKDITLRKPLFCRIFGCGYVDLITTDKTDPYLTNIGAIKNPEDLFQMIRKYNERQKKVGPINLKIII